MTPIIPLTLCLLTLGLVPALAQPDPGASATPAETATPAIPPPAPEPEEPNEGSPSPDAKNIDGLRLNFRGAPLEMVLNYLSEAAGFIIVLDTPVRGKVDVWSNTPVTREEAVNLLNSVLNRNGYAAIRNGRTLTIVNKDEAKTRDIPVRSGYDPEQMPRTDEIVTQVIPVRYTEATQLIKDLQPLVSTSTPMSANESGNAIVITDTQANIRRVAEIIQAIDTGSEAITEVRVFHLEYADPVEMADLLTSLFPDDSRSSGGNSAMGGFRRFFGGGPPQPGSGGGTNQRIRKRDRVLAVPDQRTSSVVVSAARELIDQIASMVEQLDSNPAKKQTVHVYQLQNADVQDVSQVLQEMFERNQTSANRNNNANRTSTLRNRSTQNTQRTGTSNTRTGVSGNNRIGSGF